MKIKTTKGNYIYYILGIFVTVVLSLPRHYLKGVYNPKILGWLLLIAIPLLIIMYFILLFLELKAKIYKNFIYRSIFLLALLLMYYLVFITK